MNYFWLLIATGGGLGAVARYLMQQYVQGRWPLAHRQGLRERGGLPAGRRAVGPAGTARVGAAWRLLLLTGVCGGFTTFSVFTLENTALLRAGQAGL